VFILAVIATQHAHAHNVLRLIFQHNPGELTPETDSVNDNPAGFPIHWDTDSHRHKTQTLPPNQKSKAVNDRNPD